MKNLSIKEIAMGVLIVAAGYVMICLCAIADQTLRI